MDVIDEIRKLSNCEEVREIPGYKGYYVTLSGEVWSIKLGKPKKLKPQFYKGRTIYRMEKEEKQRSTTLLRIMAMTFISDPPYEKAVASPKDGNPLNTSLENIEWLERYQVVTREMEKHNPYSNNTGLQRAGKLTGEQIEEIRQLSESGIPVYEIAPQFKITVRAVNILLRSKKESNPDWKFGRVQGETVGTSKLSEQQVREIRAMAKDCVSKSEIARRFNTTNQNVGSIVNRRTWKHVE